MKGSDLKAARDELKWTRERLAAATGLTLYTVAIIEQGKRDATPEQSEAIQRVLLEQLGRVLEETGEHPIIQGDAPPTSRTAAWNGLRRGDEVKIAGEKGKFNFLYYYSDDKQEYVQVFGPIPGTVPRSRKPKAPHERSIRPERILTL